MDVEFMDEYDTEDLIDINSNYYHDFPNDFTDDQTSFDYYEDEFGDELSSEFLSEKAGSHSLLQSLWSDCTLPVLSQSFLSSFSLILLSLIVPLLCLVPSPKPLVHLTTAGLGLATAVAFFPESWQLLVGIIFCSGLLFLLADSVFPTNRSRAVFLSTSLVVAAIYLELSLDGSEWHTLRGPAQLVAMKIISLAIDAETPRFEELFGYLLCPG